jgi:hypothetical protein
MQRDINEMHGKRRIRAPGAVWEAREVEEQTGETGHERNYEQNQIYVESKGSADCMRLRWHRLRMRFDRKYRERVQLSVARLSPMIEHFCFHVKPELVKELNRLQSELLFLYIKKNMRVVGPEGLNESDFDPDKEFPIA